MSEPVARGDKPAPTREADLVVTRRVAPPTPSHLTLVYTEGTGDLLLSPFEAALPSRLEGAYRAVSFAPEGVAGSGRAGVYFYWLCDPPFFAFVATRGTPLRVPQGERPAWSATLDRLEHETHHHRTGSGQAARALLTLLLVDAARLASGLQRPKPSWCRPFSHAFSTW